MRSIHNVEISSKGKCVKTTTSEQEEFLRSTKRESVARELSQQTGRDSLSVDQTLCLCLNSDLDPIIQNLKKILDPYETLLCLVQSSVLAYHQCVFSCRFNPKIFL